MDSAERAFGCPVFCRSFYLVSGGAKAVDSQTFQQRYAPPLVSETNVNSGRAIEPASLEMVAEARATATSPSYVTALSILPEKINLASLD
jgi:hypothetical protein